METFKTKGCFCKLSFENSVSYFSMTFRGISRANLLLSVKHFKVSSRRMLENHQATLKECTSITFSQNKTCSSRDNCPN